MKKGASFIVTNVDKGSVFSKEQFTEEHKMFEEAVSEFGRDRILPVVKELNVFNTELTREIFSEMGELGFLAVDFPEEYGGLALDKVTTLIVAEKLMTGGSASILVTVSDHTGIGTLPIIWYGSPTQKEKYLPKLASGEWMGSFALTESEAGSDALAGKMTATLNKKGTHYILNGTKIFVTNGSWSEVCVTFAKVDEKFTAFIIDKDCPGWVVGPEEHKLGIKGSSTCTFFFEDCKVPVENVLGKVGQGAAIAFDVLYTGRYKLGATTMGGSKYVIDIAIEYALEREQFNHKITDFGMIRRKFADMVIKSWEADTVTYMTAGAIDEAMQEIPRSNKSYYKILQKVIEDHGIEASISKIVGSEALAHNVDEGVQIFGGAGFIEDYAIAGMYRDERINRIFEGTSEINRLLIGGTLLKKAILEEIPIREMISEREENWIPKLDIAENDPLYKEAHIVEFSRTLLIQTLNELILKFGQDLKNEQWALEHLSNLVISLAIMDSGLKRYFNLPNEYQHKDIVIDILVASISYHSNNIQQCIKEIYNWIFDENDAQIKFSRIQNKMEELKYCPQTISAKQRIADKLVQLKHYFLD
ncbi:MAG: acyl-CoA dehydrogenase family protein [Candidatus Marinimicrobia bacterium]|nr:acyl-CoA dehydrogenase family protein [Candidatus Neomarinimicrobiota bacterium]MBL7023484.1 acyl-CoA dehydrogenase family protein [Candidatus Neomarinimicrobiota bacterium]MBL7110252.1 acyl-CoA dehydrogenase family protein [Candidatus Neomarinimicrobiota bacterium]